MGLSNTEPKAEGAAPPAEEKKGPSFGDRLGDYFQKRYPIAGGLAGAAFGQGNQVSSAPTATGVDAPLQPMPGQPQPDFSMLAQNAQPQGGGGLAMILKLLGVG